MSLIDSMMESFVILDKRRVSDGEGGFITSWEDGAEISCAIVNDTSMQAKIAESQGVTSTYTITTSKANDLDFHDIIKRVSDGKLFRITSDPKDKRSPQIATFDMMQMSAERLEALP